MADLVLDLGGQRPLAAQGRGARDPLPLGQRPHELRVRVHVDELDVGLAVLVGHPVVGLDLLAGVDALEELLGAALVGTVAPTRAVRPS